LLEDGEDVLTQGENRSEKGSLGVEAIGDDHIEGARIASADSTDEPLSRSHFALASLDRLCIEKEVEALTPKGGGHDTVVVLDALILPDHDFAAQALRAMSLVTRKDLVAVDEKRRESVGGRGKCLAALELGVESVVEHARLLRIQEASHSSKRIAARNRASWEEPPPAGTPARLLDGVEATETDREHREESGDNRAGRHEGPTTAVGEAAESLREIE
jgi:hypothetical protein